MNPFEVLGLPVRADLSDAQVRTAWRDIAARTHPDRPGGGDIDRLHRRCHRLRPAPHRLGPVRGLRRPRRHRALRPSPGHAARPAARREPGAGAAAGPGPHPARPAAAAAGPRPGRRRAVPARAGPDPGTGIRSRRGHRAGHLVLLLRPRGPGPATRAMKTNHASGGELQAPGWMGDPLRAWPLPRPPSPAAQPSRPSGPPQARRPCA